MSRRARTIPLPRVHTMGSSSMLDPPAPGGCIPSRIESRRERSGGAWDGSVDADSRCVCVCVVEHNCQPRINIPHPSRSGQGQVGTMNWGPPPPEKSDRRVGRNQGLRREVVL